MDKNVTVRFYRVGKHTADGPGLVEVLKGIFAVADVSKREAQLASNFLIRLEILEQDGSHIAGELTRIQENNLPSAVNEKGRKKLNESRLGHGIAFRFNPKSHTLAIQYDLRVASPSRFLEYLSAKWADAFFIIDPIVKADGWRRFQASPARKVRVKIATPQQISSIDKEEDAAFSALSSMANSYGAQFVTLELSMGRKDGALSEAIKGSFKKLLRLGDEGLIDLEEMRATAKTAGEPNDDINLLEELLDFTEELALPDNNPSKNYEVRKAYLKRLMATNVK